MIKLTLQQVLDSKNITRYRLAKMTGIQYQTVDSYYKNQVGRYDSYILDKFCEALHCDPGELLSYHRNDEDTAQRKPAAERS